MSEPKIAAKKPSVLDVAAGKHAYCTCGESTNQPFCDGAHAGGSFRPLIFELEVPGKVALCQCKRTGNSPYCDGTHSALD